ncbi:molybdopterin biosynthesis protein [Agathobaculum sp.]|uniref:molybdopterin biosynthesis protein n=1 Tax=Agathobaculum sp. TaxID=2048138 RepID=UPI002A808FD8|nr:molybdopterin biosynthesis protein [Agathobaculum sp.]MDY3618691.1 molybdopterin biosynthesis protein [Agathobaculum sp.]
MENNRYIENYDAEQTIEAYAARFSWEDAESIETVRAHGRVTAAPCYARVSDPCYHAAAMDGIMVCAADTVGASETTPMTLEQGQYAPVNTGDPIRQPYDSVVMIEDVVEAGGGRVRLITPSFPWQHVRAVGESVVSGEMILPSAHRIRPIDIGALLAGGVETLNVRRRLMIGIIPTGHELVEHVDELRQGRLVEYNSHVFSALAEEYDAEAKRYPIVRGDQNELSRALSQAVDECDIVVINAGSSAGTRDFTRAAIEAAGTVYAHGLAIRPGKPTVLGEARGKPVLGIPGYPVAAYLMFQKCLRALLRPGTCEKKVKARLVRRVVSALRHEELIRVSVGWIGGEWTAAPLERGAASIMSVVRADGVLTIPQQLEGLEAGAAVEVVLTEPAEELRQTLQIIGSHDLMLDELRERVPLKSVHVGSMNGLLALKNGQCHLAPIHILDEDTGRYNENLARAVLGAGDYSIIRGVGRVQGFYLRAEDPLETISFAELVQPEISLANRQRGAGTRLLLDYHLRLQNIDSGAVDGYRREWNTHMAVASAVQSGMCRTGLGVYSAAKALGLRFVPVCEEQYDFAVRTADLEDPRVLRFIKGLQSDWLQERLSVLGGYTVRGIGEIRSL